MVKNQVKMNEVDQLQDTLCGMADIYLNSHINFMYWEEFDELDQHSLDVIDGFLFTTFRDLIEKYPSMSILPECRDDLTTFVWASMDLPFPRNPEYYISRVQTNLMNHFDQNWYERLYDAIEEPRCKVDLLINEFKNLTY